MPVINIYLLIMQLIKFINYFFFKIILLIFERFEIFTTTLKK